MKVVLAPTETSSRPWSYPVFGMVLHGLSLSGELPMHWELWPPVFAFVTFTWIFFRSETLGDAAIIISRIFSAGLEDPEFPLVALTLCLSIWLYQFLYDSGARKLLSHTTVRVTLMVLMLFAIIFASSNPEAFIYFQF